METASQTALERLKQLEEQLALTPEAVFANPGIAVDAMDALPDAIVFSDEEGRIRLMNHAAEELFDYNRDEMLGRPVVELMPERFHKCHEVRQTEFFSDPRKRSFDETDRLFALDSKGREIPVKILLQPIESQAGNLAMAIIRRVT